MRDPASVPLYVPIVEVRSRLADLINRVAYGHESIIFTRHGKPVCALTPINDPAPRPDRPVKGSHPRRR